MSCTFLTILLPVGFNGDLMQNDHFIFYGYSIYRHYHFSSDSNCLWNMTNLTLRYSVHILPQFIFKF